MPWIIQIEGFGEDETILKHVGVPVEFATEAMALEEIEWLDTNGYARREDCKAVRQDK